MKRFLLEIFRSTYNFCLVYSFSFILIYETGYASQFYNFLAKRYGSECVDKIEQHEDLYSIISQPFNYSLLRKLYDGYEEHYGEELVEKYKIECAERLSWIEFKTLQDQGFECLALFDEVRETKGRLQLYFELYKALAFYTEIPSFHTIKWLEDNFSLLKLGKKITKESEERSLELFPPYPGRPNSRFAFEEADLHCLSTYTSWSMKNTPPYPYAALKSNGEWDREQMVWILSYLFEFDSAFAPTGVIEAFGMKCSVQPFWIGPEISKPTKPGSGSIIYNLAFENYIDACLGALVLSLYDQSSVNCRFRQLVNGQYALVNFDNGAFMASKNGIRAEFDTNSQLIKLVRSVWAWYFDFPQFDWIIKGSDLEKLKKKVSNWNQRVVDFKRALKHPLNNFLQNDESYWIQAFEARIRSITEKVLLGNPFSARDLLYNAIPEYKPLIEALELYIPSAKGVAMTSLGCVFYTMPALKHWMIHRFNYEEFEIDQFIEWLNQTYQKPCIEP